MKGIPELRIMNRLPERFRYAFMVEMDKKAIDRIQIITWLGVFLYVCLFVLDIERARAGTLHSNPDHKLLLYFHIGGMLYLIPALLTTYAKTRVKATRLSRGVIIWFTLFLMIVLLYGQSFVAFRTYGSLTMYLTFIIVTNWTITMNHLQRLTFNLLASLTMIGWLIFLAPVTDTVQLLTKIYETFFFTLIAVIFGIFDYNLRGAKFLEEQELAKEKARIQEMELTKSRMYANLTHEFRTPLTVIAGMAGQIATNPSRWATKGAEMVRRNALRILNLVDQILDLSKLESGSLPVQLIYGDIVPFFNYLIDAFKPYAESKNIRIHFLPETTELVIAYDRDKAQTLTSNLLSNAIKYTPEGGDIYVYINKLDTVTGPRMQIRVRDTGIGIPEDQQQLIFERFYQVRENNLPDQAGTGIGLAIVSEIVKLMDGTIRVSSRPGKGTEFILDFPVLHHINATSVPPFEGTPLFDPSVYFDTPMPATPNAEMPASKEGEQDATRILVIEDNPDVTLYLKSILGNKYELLAAPDSDTGLALAIGEIPDLIVSDIMMPGKDGLALCTTIKEDFRTSHIPVILLTARTESEARVAGYQSGADAYITKPFDQEELHACIRQLLDTRRKLQEYYIAQFQIDASSAQPAIAEDPFVIKARDAIITHIDDTEFSIERLGRQLGVSRTQLHNKLKALTQRSASHFIRIIRLQEARKLLKDESLTISEVAYACGFNDPGYFARVYREEFGISPSEYREKSLP